MNNLRGSDTIPLVKVSPDTSASEYGEVGGGRGQGEVDGEGHQGDGDGGLQNQAPDVSVT